MTQPALIDPNALQDLQVIDSEGSKVGKVNAVFLENATGHPSWAAVKTGLFGGHVTLVPLDNATADADELSVPFTKDTIKDAPHHDPDADLTPAEEAELFRHYGITHSSTGQVGTSETQQVQAQEQVASQGHDTSGPNTDTAMTRSEERLRVGTEQVETGKARLRKYIVTENVTKTVPVTHEEVRVEREPITDANRDAALSGAELTEEEHEVVLHAERPVVTTETVPVERVRLATETVQSEQEVTSKVRSEQIEQVADDSKR
jgi:uncharacterized protein (TIGR02271 family)